MGLDISFSTKEALQAGLSVNINFEDNSQWREGGEFAHFGMPEEDRLSYTISVPDTDLLVEADVRLDVIWVRANKWGAIYAPLTRWLKSKAINWSEC